MDGIYLFFLWSGLMLFAGFGAGRYMPMNDVQQTISKTGEVQIRHTVYQCKPVASMVDGRRLEIK
jgi:hypothetical protein